MKKVIITLLALLITTSAIPLTAYAKTDDLSKKSIITGELIPTEEEEQEYLDSLSQDDLLRIQKKENEAKILNSQINTKAATKISIPGPLRCISR